jgi:hypothetical protein
MVDQKIDRPCGELVLSRLPSRPAPLENPGLNEMFTLVIAAAPNGPVGVWPVGRWSPVHRFQSSNHISGLIEFVGPCVDDGIVVEVVDSSHDTILRT